MARRTMELKNRAFVTRGSLLRDPAFTYYLYCLAWPREKLGPGMLTLRNLSDFSG